MKIARTSLAFVALAFVAVPIAGCMTDADSSADPAPVAEAAQAVVQDLTTLDAIQQDQAFFNFNQAFRNSTGPFVRRGMSLTKQGRADFLAGLKNLQCSSSSCPELNNYLANWGMQPIDPNMLVGVMQQEEQLRARGASTENLVHALINFQGIEYQINPVDGSQYNQNPEYQGCLDDCAVEFAYAAYLAMSAYITSLAACAATTVGWPICVAVATAAYAFALYEADQALEGCKDRCDQSCDSGSTGCGSGSTSTLNQSCTYDSDCAAAEHCSTLIQGLPGKCKSDFHDGHTCARNAWCTSGHCAWYYLCVP